MMQKIRRWRRKLKQHFQKAILSSHSPHEIALAFSIATLILIAPTPGLNILLVISSYYLFRALNIHLSPIGLFAGFIVWNPIVQIPLVFASLFLGIALFQGRIPSELTLDSITMFSSQYVVGALVLAALFAVSFYFIIKRLVSHHREKMIVETLVSNKHLKRNPSPIL
ncbi:DUF2062 domain-containing protein [Candidatus Woesearchaeota archaeon]|nr:DUF2062 domain-containing protein [Candidatus Woesearchaeota archaeon]